MKPLRILVILALISLCGCSKLDRFESSKIVDHTALTAAMRQAASAENIEWNGGGGGGGGSFRAEVEVDGEVNQAARARFISSLRATTQKLLADQGAVIHGWGKQGNDDNLVGFSWEYTWKGNNGLMRVRYFPGSNEKGRLSVFCYEHKRDAPEPPRAKGF